MRALTVISCTLIALSSYVQLGLGQDRTAIYALQAVDYLEKRARDSAETFAKRAFRLDSIDPVVNGLSEYVLGKVQ